MSRVSGLAVAPPGRPIRPSRPTARRVAADTADASGLDLLRCGRAVDAAVTGTLVERWDGTHWTIVPTPKPPGAKGAELDGIACTSASTCLAAGAIDNPNQQTPLAERWDGTHWTILSTPKPPGAQGGLLNGVACSSQAACTIAGLAFTPSHPYIYADRWNGAKLTFQSTPALPGAFDIDNPAVACPSATSCTAVGAFTNTFPYGPKLRASAFLCRRWLMVSLAVGLRIGS